MKTTQLTIARIEHALTWGLHFLVAILLVLVCWRASHWGVWVLVACYSVVYVAGVIPTSPFRTHRMGWLIVLSILWASLIWDGPEPAYLVFPMFFLCVMITTPLKSAILIAVLTAIAVVTLAMHLGFSIGVVTGPILGALVAWVLGTCFQLLTQTLKELVDARASAIRASKSAGEQAERARIAGEIHDTVAQGLSSIQMLLHAAEKRVDDPQALSHIQLARQTTAENLAETRNIIAALQPTPLIGADLPVALARLTSTTPMGQHISFEVDGNPRVLPDHMEAEILRVAQTLVGNVVRHSKAEQAKVTLTYQDDQVLLDVLDNGQGFDVAEVMRRQSVGLPTAQRRAEGLGGRLIIESTIGSGTGISARFPYPTRSQNQ
ncbi:two-component system sensor histidine kinase [Corynebacterium suranareeae]|uniref:Two-component system sensor histidine kinase n=1 Tax=Corynebacterium suranareeae TaxID=2506452 RepID=A0A160PRS2_9CORY|nr:sensor histidine kinase [Corynebacterium suranareeae]BAU96344.1 two-component system sensor histidine kinase [Corynebacterium suranareeae]